MNDCLYILEGISVVTLVQRRKVERLQLVASIREG